MKFGKSLSGQIVETLPEWRDKFLSYKDLKKRLKLIGAGGAGAGSAAERQPKRARREDAGEADASSAAPAAAAAMTPEEADFMQLLEAELDKFNSFFVEKEEEYIIRQKVLYPIRPRPSLPSPMVLVFLDLIGLFGLLVRPRLGGAGAAGPRGQGGGAGLQGGAHAGAQGDRRLPRRDGAARELQRPQLHW
jgi:hypothetical protein